MTNRPALPTLTLQRVDPNKLLFERLDTTEPGPPPAWFDESNNGSLRLDGWVDGTVTATVEAAYIRDHCAASVAVTGLYSAENPSHDKQAAGGPQGDDDYFTDMPGSEVDEFSVRVVNDLYPYLRAELQMLSSRAAGYPGIALAPRPIVTTPPG